MNQARKLYVGWQKLHPDPSLNFQLNRWAALGGPAWVNDIRPVLPRLVDYDAGVWTSTFCALGEAAAAQGRTLHAALHFRSAEFFMAHDDPRKDPLRRRLIAMMREAYGVSLDACTAVPFGRLSLPVWRFPVERPAGTALVFGGFDGYIEEMFGMFLHMNETERWSVVAFEGPGQGAVLEDQHAPMTPDWDGPVKAVIDALGLQDVTLVGVSLGGCLVMRAAAFEPRVRRVVAFDVMEDLFECATRQQPAIASLALRGLLAVGAQKVINEGVPFIAQSRPVAEWGLGQAEHVFGKQGPAEAIEAMRAYQTRDISDRINQDVLLLAGAGDHYVPLDQLWRQARLLTSARSITARVFTAKQHAQAHCQVGNLPLALKVFTSWAASLDA